MGLIIHRRKNEWEPIASQQNWYTFRAEDVTVSTGISYVDDRMGHTDLQQTTGANQPAFTASGINGQPCATFDGTNDYLRGVSTFTEVAEPYTVVLVAKLAGSGNTGVFGGVANTVGVGRSTDKWYMFNASPLLEGGTIGASAHSLVCKFLTGANDEIRMDGVAQATGHEGGTNKLDGITLGNFRELGGTTYLNGQIGEVMVFKSDVTGSDLTALESYLGRKWGTH